MKNKILEYEQSYLAYQYDLVDELEKRLNELTKDLKPSDTMTIKEQTLFVQIGGHIYNIFYRIQGIKAMLKSVFNYDLKVPIKYDKYMKGIIEPYYLKSDVLYTMADEKVDELITLVKSKK